ncbi:MAG: nucleoside deaminase [Elusimicrobiota bacterium]
MNYLSLAADTANRSMKKGCGGPFGAVIVKNGKIISFGWNTVLSTCDPTSHAEVNAIRKASLKLRSFHLTGCVIYSTTEPCPMCFSAIHWAKIKKIVYATTIRDVALLGFNELNISNTKMKKWGKSNVDVVRKKDETCIKLLRDWKNLSHPKIY